MKDFLYDFKYMPYRAWYRVTELKDRMKWAWQRAYRGYDDTAYWSLYSYLAEIALPVLESMRDKAHGHPLGETRESWQSRLDDMVTAFKLILDDDWSTFKDKEIQGKIEKGLKLFAKYYRHLWD